MTDETTAGFERYQFILSAPNRKMLICSLKSKRKGALVKSMTHDMTNTPTAKHISSTLDFLTIPLNIVIANLRKKNVGYGDF